MFWISKMSPDKLYLLVGKIQIRGSTRSQSCTRLVYNCQSAENHLRDDKPQTSQQNIRSKTFELKPNNLVNQLYLMLLEC